MVNDSLWLRDLLNDSPDASVSSINVYHGRGRYETVKSIIKDGILYPATGEASEFYTDVLRSLGKDALKRRRNFTLEQYVEDHEEELIKYGSRDTLIAVKVRIGIGEDKDDIMYRCSCVWVFKSDITKDNNWAGYEFFFEFLIPVDSVAFDGNTGETGIVPGGIPLRYLTKIIINDSNYKKDLEATLKDHGYTRVEVVVR